MRAGTVINGGYQRKALSLTSWVLFEDRKVRTGCIFLGAFGLEVGGGISR